MHFDPPPTYFMAAAEHRLRVRDAHAKSLPARTGRTIRRRRPRPVK
jgi:hypothetical protein